MEYEINSWLLWGGLSLGVLFGAVVQRSGFCMSAVVSNLVIMRDYRQFHAFLAAIIIAVTGTQLLGFSGLVDLSETTYLVPRMNWSGAILGGLIFGFGTILAGGCIGRTVVRVGEGNISSFIALLVMGVAAAATMYGPLEPLRVWFYQATVFEIPTELASIPGLFDIPAVNFISLFAVTGLAIIFITGGNNRSPGLIFAGLIIGLLIVAGWWLTGNLSRDIFSLHRPASLTFAGPLANSAYALSRGSILSEGAIFGMMLLLGTVLGSFIMAVSSGRFRWVKPERSHLCHIIIGGLLMGMGAIIAGGCNIGNGLTGLSVLSVRSMIAVIAIFAGMRMGIYWLSRSENRVAERTLGEKPAHWYSFMYRT